MDPNLHFSFGDSHSRRSRRSEEPAHQTTAPYPSATTNSSPIILNIDNSYAQIHRSIDEAFGTISRQLPVIMEKVRLNNQTVVDKLVSYEHEFQLRGTPDLSIDSMSGDTSTSTPNSVDYDWLLNYLSNVDPPPPSIVDTEQDSSNPSSSDVSSSSRSARHPAANPGARRGAYDMNIDTPPESTSNSQAGSVTHSKRRPRPNGPPTPAATLVNAPPSPPESGTGGSNAPGRKQRRSHGFADKFWQIASTEAEDRVREFAQRYRMTHDTSSSEPHCVQFLATTQITDGSKFLRMLPCLAFAIEFNTFEELKHRVQKRIALAHFYHAYTLAQQNPETFLAWCDEQPFRQSMLPNGGYKSIVLQRFADLMFPASASSTLSRRTSSSKTRIGKIQTWRKIGKPWAKIIKQFGYGILLLVPPNLTDEDLRLTVDEELARILQLAEGQKHRFEGPLQVADELVRKCLFDQGDGSSEWPDIAMSGEGDWNSLLQSSHFPN